MSTDAQDQAKEGQSPATTEAHVRGGHARAHAEAHQSRGSGQEQQEVAMVKVRFDGAPDPETNLLEHAGWRLHKGQEVEVPEPVFEQLTQGDNAKLYRVVKVEEPEKVDD